MMTPALSAASAARTDDALLEELLDAFEAVGVGEQDMQWVVFRTRTTTVVLLRAPLVVRAAGGTIEGLRWVPFASAAVGAGDNRVVFVEPSARSTSPGAVAARRIATWQEELWAPPTAPSAPESEKAGGKAPALSARYARIGASRVRPSAAEELGALFAGARAVAEPVVFTGEGN